METKEYVAEYIVDSKDSFRETTLDDCKTYFNFLRSYLNKMQDKVIVETHLQSRKIEGQIHLFVKIKSSILDMNELFEYLNSQCSMAYVVAMTDDDNRLWADISRLYQYLYFEDIARSQKIDDSSIQDDEGWITLEQLKEGIEKRHIVEGK